MTKTTPLTAEVALTALALMGILVLAPASAQAARGVSRLGLPAQAGPVNAFLNAGAGNNGGATTGNGGNGGNSSPGGLVRAGSVVSNATAINMLNVNIVRIGR